MVRVVLLVPPNKEGYIRDTYYGCWHKRKFVHYSWPPLMLYYLHAEIPDSALLDAPARSLDAEAAFRTLASLGPEVIVTNVGTFTVGEDVPFLQRAKRELGCIIVLFGEYATTQTAEAVKIADFVIRGESENLAARLAEAIPDMLSGKKSRAQVAHEVSPAVCVEGAVTEEKHLVQKLDILPFPRRITEDRDLYANPFAKRHPFATTLATRGCPYDCIFCTVPALYGKSFRIRSPENVLAELRLLQDQGFGEVFFRDENLTLHRRFVTALCEGIIREGLDVRWMSNSRVDSVDADLLGLMQKAGCHLLKFGVESFSDETLRAIKKGATAAQVRSAFSLCRDAGIQTVAHMILGNPGEDERGIWRNVEELLAVDPTYASFDVVLTYEGTELSRLEARGAGTAIPRERLEWIHDRAFRKFYFRPRLLLSHLRSLENPGELIRKGVASLQLWRGLLQGVA